MSGGLAGKVICFPPYFVWVIWVADKADHPASLCRENSRQIVASPSAAGRRHSSQSNRGDAIRYSLNKIIN